jgi:hypothetical protein
MLFSNIAHSVLSHVAGCPEDLAASAVRDAAIEFCFESRCLITSIDVSVGPGGVDIIDTANQVVDVLDAKINGETVCVSYINDSEAIAKADAESSSVILMTDPNNIVLYPDPTVATSVQLLVALAPGPSSTDLYDEAWKRHSEAIRFGALTRLFEVPKRAWSDPQLAIYYRGKFEESIKKAQANTHKSHELKARRLRVRPA